MPRRTVEVRRAVPEDADLLLALAERARADADVERALPRPQAVPPRERLAATMGRPDVEVHLALSGEGQPVGVLVLRLGELLVLTGGTAVHVEELYVRPSWRRRGVARELLAAAVAAGERGGAEDVACVLPPGGRDVARFFARLGFAPLVTVRAVPVARLRARLGARHGDGRRRAALDKLVARRRRQLDRPETPAAGLPAVAPAVARSAELSQAGRRAAGR
jgi:GNAT superfamily N-acetyltransferase